MLLTAFTMNAQKSSKTQSKAKTQTKEFMFDKPAYLIYDSIGNKVTYAQMVEAMSKKEVCLFGEIHNDPISHWLEKNLIASFYAEKKNNFVVGAEMWETDNQIVLDELQKSKLIDGSTYLESSKLWNNLKTDYLTILKYCLKNDIYFSATNIPRRYAKMVYKKGIGSLDSLSDQAKSYLPPLPIHFNMEESVYKNMAKVFPTDEEFIKRAKEGKKSNNPMMQAKPSDLVKAQAIKDATMAWNIVKNLDQGKFMFHFNGEMHSANHTAISYYLKYYRPQTTIGTISVVKQKDVLNLKENNVKRADFLIVVADNMNETYEQKLF